MNDTQRRSPGRLADLSPFDNKVKVETPKSSAPAQNAGCCELLRAEAETYGCVEWYQYPRSRARSPERKIEQR